MQFKAAVEGASFPVLNPGMQEGKHKLLPGHVVVGKVLDLEHDDEFFNGVYSGRKTILTLKIIEHNKKKEYVGRIFRHYINGKRRLMLLMFPCGIGDHVRIKYDGKDMTATGVPPHLIYYDVAQCENPRYIADPFPQGKINAGGGNNGGQQQAQQKTDAVGSFEAPPPPPQVGG